MADRDSIPPSPRDWHVLVALSEGPLHGYGIMKAVERDSGGKVSVEIGSLYRILDRLGGEGLLAEADAPEDAPDDTRGRPRRYYRLTERGRVVVGEEAIRLREALELARARSLVPESAG